MRTIVLDTNHVRIPVWVNDLASFRRWSQSDTFPETGRACFLSGELWIDISKEQFFSHNQVKSEFNIVLGGMVKKEKLGRYIPDGMLLTNTEADLSCQPDAAFVSRECLAEGKVRLVEGSEGGYVELEGWPDMVLEVVSPSSVEKDTVLLRDLYWQAGIQEYWLVDAREEKLLFEILRSSSKGFITTRPQKGWLKSRVFGKFFQLLRRLDENGDPEYELLVQ